MKTLISLQTDIRHNILSHPVAYPVAYTLFLLALGLLSINAFFPFFLNKIGLNEITVIGVFISAYILARVLYGLDLGKHFFRLNYFVICPILSLTILAMQIFQNVTFANSLYTYFHIDFISFTYIYLFFFALILPNFHLSQLKRFRRLSLFVTPIYFYPVILFYWINIDFYFSLEKEDGFFEYLTFFFFLYIAFVGAFGYYKTRVSTAQVAIKRLFLVLFSFMVLAGIVFAGEEISWGQRIIGFSTPEHLSEVNTQHELNLHNNKAVFRFVYYVYALVSTFFVLAPLARHIATRIIQNQHFRHWVEVFIPDWSLIPYFIPNLIYTYVRVFYLRNATSFDIWEEVSEVFFAAGLVMYTIHILYHSYVSFQVYQEKGAKGKKKS
jgi:hypothetical protein